MKRSLMILVLLTALPAAADERILEFSSDIRVTQAGWLDVTETIVVRAEGNRIRRGIYRDFPTSYRDQYGNDVEVVYEPGAVLRNDEPEDSFSERNRNGIRTYFGSADRLLAPGVYAYTFRYRADRMLGFFAEHDELYWNVTGLDWAFPIDKVSARVTLDFEGDASILEASAYTGMMGSRASDANARIDGDVASFETTKELLPHHGLTIVVTWPKGFIAQPDAGERIGWVLADNANLLAMVGGIAAMLAYLIFAWLSYGRDPEEGLIITRYEPPEGFSPASLRFIQQMYYDNKVMTAAVVNLAVKGYLRIEEDDGDYTLRRTDPGNDPPPLATGERELHDALFADGDTLVLDNEYHERIGRARGAHRRSLRRDYRGRFFRTNGLLNLPAIAIGALAVLFAINLGSGVTVPVIALIVVMVIIVFVFATIMRRPTMLGRKVLDDTLGFRDYLEYAEKDDMNLRNPPERTPQLFESYLPFALALGVEQVWAQRFAGAFASATDGGGGGYQPSWYSGNWSGFNLAASTSAISDSLGSAISSSVTPPGSSSGGGGGGFSGGGGGGGGGGGW